MFKRKGAVRCKEVLVSEFFIRVLATLLWVTSGAVAQLPDKEVIIDQMRRVNDYWIVDNIDYGNNNWDRAVYYHGNNRLFFEYPDSAYYRYSLDWANLYDWQVFDNPTTRFADDHACGTAYIELYMIDPSPEKINPLTQNIGAMVQSTERDDWWWIDAFYMAMPVFTKLGVLHGDDSYFQAMYELFDDTRTQRGLYNAEDGFWYRDENYLPPYKEPNGEDTYWSRGNGWVFAALARVLDELPEDAPHRQEYVDTYRAMAEALKKVQRTDGFWNPSLHDPDNHGGPEASGTSFFIFGIAWGINNGVLDSVEYIDAVINGWNGLNSIAVHEDGKLGYCQHIGKDPQPAYFDDTKDYAVGAFILAGAEVLALAPGQAALVKENVAEGTLVTTSNQQDANPATGVNDGDLVTRWSAETYPQWVELDLDSVITVETIELVSYENRSYTFVVEGKQSAEESYSEIAQGMGTFGGVQTVALNYASVQFLRITITGPGDHYNGDWVSVNELRVFPVVQEVVSSQATESSSEWSSQEILAESVSSHTLQISSEIRVSVSSSSGLYTSSSSESFVGFSSALSSSNSEKSSVAEHYAPIRNVSSHGEGGRYIIANTFENRVFENIVSSRMQVSVYSITGQEVGVVAGGELMSFLRSLPQGSYVLNID